MFEGIDRDNSRSRRYFTAALIAFLASFVLMDSSKWTNNIFYAFIALPGLVFLIKERGAGLLHDKLGLAWLVFLLWFLVPAVIAGEGQFYKHIAYVTLFVFTIAGLTNQRFLRSEMFARVLFWAICLYVFGYAAYAYLTGIHVLGERVNLMPARMQNVIYTSIWLLCALALAMPGWLHRRRWFEAFCAVVLSVVAVTFVMQTRTAMSVQCSCSLSGRAGHCGVSRGWPGRGSPCSLYSVWWSCGWSRTRLGSTRFSSVATPIAASCSM